MSFEGLLLPQNNATHSGLQLEVSSFTTIMSTLRVLVKRKKMILFERMNTDNRLLFISKSIIISGLSSEMLRPVILLLMNDKVKHIVFLLIHFFLLSNT